MFIESLGELEYSGLPFYPYSIIAYADDVVFIAKGIGIMRRLLRYFSDFLTSNHMSVSISKCGSFNSSTLKIQNSNNSLVNSYKYLGVLLKKDGISQKDLLQFTKRRIDTIFHSGKSFGFKNYCLYNASIYLKTFIRSTIEYYIPLMNLTHFKQLNRHIYK
eukprot:NODE_77_length_23806_cov_0.393892.p12 type:complete len:161 gc:universal NODE_77_length_23806_cov_0.393892:4642-4160(-)